MRPMLGVLLLREGLLRREGKGLIAVALGLENVGPRRTSDRRVRQWCRVPPIHALLCGTVLYSSIRRVAFLGVHDRVQSVESCTCVRENRRRIALVTRGAWVRNGVLTCVLPRAAVAESKSTAVRVRQRVAGQGGDIPRPDTYDTRSRRCPYGTERLLLHPWSATYRDSP
jgi:hypothetical protein